MQPYDGTPLAGLSGISEAVAGKLNASWITTAEQLVGAVAASGGATAMATHLGVHAAELRRALAAAEAAIPEPERTRLRTPADTRNFGLGGRTDSAPD
jgi:hypothetical protein